MNMIGSNALAMLTGQADEAVAELSKVEHITGDNCGRVKDLVDNAKKLAKDIEESRKLAKSPHEQAAKAVDLAYAPLRDRLIAAADGVKRMVEAWVLAERRKAEAAAAEARRIAEEAAKTAAEVDPFLQDEDAATQAAETLALAETRALASRQVVSASGASKASTLRKVRSANVTDSKALVLFYHEHPDVLGAATRLANAAIRAAKGGPVSIPGVEVKEEEKLV